jgi:hypothetical protein
MAIILDGTTGITTPGLINTGSETVVNLTTSGNTTLGDASGDTLTLNGSTVSTPNGLNFDSNTFVIDATNNRVAIGNGNPSVPFEVVTSSGTSTAKIWSATNTSPIASLELQRGTNATWGADAYGDYRLSNAAGALLFQYGESGTTTERMRIDSSGNVGIGTSSANDRLHVYHPTANVVANFESGDPSAYISFKDSDTPSYANVFLGATNEDMVFFTATNERMRIDSDGVLLLGTDVQPITSGESGIALYKPSSGYGRINVGKTASGVLYALRCYYDGTAVGGITYSDTATALVTSSDYRLKENITPMTGALAKVQAIKPVTYNWKSDGSSGQGFIAHELAEIVPECVVGEKDAVDEEGNPEYQGINTSFLVATLTAAIQEQQALINDLTTRLTALENK